jgi:hypothetical protein
VAILAMSSVMIPAQAAMIQTQDLAGQAELLAGKEKISAFLTRQDVQQRLLKQGVSVDEAQARVDALSPSEVAFLSENIDQLPAGGDVLGVLVFVFLVLLFTDIMGYTNVFPFVVAPRN